MSVYNEWRKKTTECIFSIKKKADNGYVITDKDCLDFINTNTKYPKVLVTTNCDFLKYDKKGITIVIATDNMNTTEMAKLIIKKIKTDKIIQ